MANSYILRDCKNDRAISYHTEVHAFASAAEAAAWIRERDTEELRRADEEWDRRISIAYRAITEKEAERLIASYGCVRHGGAEYTDAMWDFDEHERRWEEEDLFGDDVWS